VGAGRAPEIHLIATIKHWTLSRFIELIELSYFINCRFLSELFSTFIYFLSKVATGSSIQYSTASVATIIVSLLLIRVGIESVVRTSGSANNKTCMVHGAVFEEKTKSRCVASPHKNELKKNIFNHGLRKLQRNFPTRPLCSQ
jgi:hypothetical protein